MKDTLPKGRQFTATENEVGKGKVKAGGKKAQSAINKMLATPKKKGK